MFKGMFNDSNWAGILSLLIFFSVFIIAVVMTLMKRKSDVDYMAHLPLDDDDTLNNSKKK